MEGGPGRVEELLKQLEAVTLERDNSERVRAMLETRLKRMEQQLVSEGDCVASWSVDVWLFVHVLGW